MSGNARRSPIVTLARLPPELTPPATSPKDGRGMWPQCGARVARTVFAVRQTPARPSQGSFRPRRMGDFVAVQSENSRLCSVDIARVGRLYSPDMARRPLHGAMARLRSSSLITVTRPPILVGGGRLRRLSGLPGSGDRPVPGCLTGESEERETWTAGSLRAVSSRGSSPFKGIILQRATVE